MRFLKLFILFEITSIVSITSLKINKNPIIANNILSNINSKKYNLLSKFSFKDEFSTNIFKQQVLNELKNSEDVLKNILFKIVNHLYEYVRYRLVSSFFSFYLINPFNIQLGNLLNTQINNYYLTSKLNIPTYSTPISFGINYQQVNLNKNFGYKLNNNCWFVRSYNPNADRAFVLMHGWFGNLQSSLPFLNLLNQVGVLNNCHVLVLNLYDNLNNSFESNIGLKGVTDLYDAVHYLYRNHGVTKFSVYTQSVSALSALLFYDYVLSLKDSQYSVLSADSDDSFPSNYESEDGETCYFKKNCDKEMLKNIDFDKLVLESPVVNIKQYTTDFKYYDQLLSMTNNRFDGHLNKLNLSDYLRKKEIRKKVSIFQGLKDDVTTVKMLKEELQKVENLPEVFLFRKSGHIDFSVHNPNEYYRAVNYVLNSSPFFKLFKFNKNKVKSLRQLN